MGLFSVFSYRRLSAGIAGIIGAARLAVEQGLPARVQYLVQLLAQAVDLELGPERQVIAYLRGAALRCHVLKQRLVERHHVKFPGVTELFAVYPGDPVEGFRAPEIRGQRIHSVRYLKAVGYQRIEKRIVFFFDVQVTDNEEVAVERLAFADVCAAVDEVHHLLYLLASLVAFGLCFTVIVVGRRDDEIETPGRERCAIGHAVKLIAYMGFGGHVKPDIAGKPGRDHRAFVVEEGKPFMVTGGVGYEDSVIARQRLLQSPKAAQVGLDLLQGDDVEPFADIGDVLDRAIGMAVGELLGIPRCNQQVLVQFTARDFTGMRIHESHQLLAFSGDCFCTGRRRLAPRSGFRI